MKKLFSFIAILCIAISVSAKTTETFNIVKTAETFHQDVQNVVSTVHEDVKSVTTTLYGDGKDAIVTLYPDVKSAVIAIAKAIGCAAEHVYEVLVKKFVVDGIVQLFPFLLGVILIIISWIKLESYFKKNDKIDWHILYPLALVISGIVILCCVNYNVLFMGLINPEYGALNYILEYSKTMLK